MNFFTKYTNTAATNYARDQYLNAISANGDNETPLFIDLSKRIASLATALLLFIPGINIIAEKILSAAGFHEDIRDKNSAIRELAKQGYRIIFLNEDVTYRNIEAKNQFVALHPKYPN